MNQASVSSGTIGTSRLNEISKLKHRQSPYLIIKHGYALSVNIALSFPDVEASFVLFISDGTALFGLLPESEVITAEV